MGTKVIVQKICEGEYEYKPDKYIDYMYIHEEYYHYEILFNEKEFNRFYITIRSEKYSKLYIAASEPHELLWIMEDRYLSLLEDTHLNFEIGLSYQGSMRLCHNRRSLFLNC